MGSQRDYTRKVLFKKPDGTIVTAQRTAGGSVTNPDKKKPTGRKSESGGEEK